MTLEVPYSAFAPIVGGSFVKNCTPAAQNKTMVTDAMEMTQLALTEKQIFIDAFVQLNNQIRAAELQPRAVGKSSINIDNK